VIEIFPAEPQPALAISRNRYKAVVSQPILGRNSNDLRLLKAVQSRVIAADPEIAFAVLKG